VLTFELRSTEHAYLAAFNYVPLFILVGPHKEVTHRPWLNITYISTYSQKIMSLYLTN
jgi:hypothetical protein